jgi:carbamoyl-phosphate synthase large subunit
VRKVSEEGAAATVVDLIRRAAVTRHQHAPGFGARSDGYLIREAALVARVPCITTLSGTQAAIQRLRTARSEDALSLQERHAEARTA